MILRKQGRAQRARNFAAEFCFPFFQNGGMTSKRLFENPTRQRQLPKSAGKGRA
jgi:hypothetical protein